MFFGVAAARTCDLIVRSMPVCPLPRERKMTKKAARTLSIENVPLGILKLDRRNPRQHSRQQIAQIARSIEAFGFNVPILVDESMTVLAGHGRAQAGQQIGLQEVPIIRLAHLSEAQARAFSVPSPYQFAWFAKYTIAQFQTVSTTLTLHYGFLL
jgi:hypothetical protein